MTIAWYGRPGDLSDRCERTGRLAEISSEAIVAAEAVADGAWFSV